MEGPSGETNASMPCGVRCLVPAPSLTRRLSILVLMLASLQPVHAMAGTYATASPPQCPPETGEARAVVRILDPASFALDDGSELRLMGILPASSRDVSESTTERVRDWPPEREAQVALQRLVANGRVSLSPDGASRDRYGRRISHAFINDAEGMSTWLQAALVEAGQARVAPLPGQTLCMTALLQRETVARATRKGLWKNPAYAIRDARDTRTLRSLKGTFQIVERRVLATGVTRHEAFLNFGRNWRWDFTAAVDLRRIADRQTLIARLKALEGRNIRVRGWIERRNGPFIALTSPDAIEELPQGFAPAGAR